MTDDLFIKKPGEEEPGGETGKGKRAPSRRDFLAIAAASAAAAAAAACRIEDVANNIALAGPKKTKVDTPTISCGTSTAVSININVCAGATGAPAGFSIQWMTAPDYAANGWPVNSDCPLDVNGNPTCPASFCKASFSGNANLSRYNLGPNECVVVNLGEFLFDEGASTNCPGALVCGTDYVFRAFAHANSTLNRSDFTANLTCSTLPCGCPENCTLTQGYWKTHNNLVCDVDPTSPLCVIWPVTTLTLGTVSYTVAQLVSILNTPASGNGLIALAHQLIAAKLNIAKGANGTAAAQCIADADALIGGLVIPPVGSGSLAASATSALTTCLASYNEGLTGPGHCDC
jgi:hypothetical protein